MIRLQQIKLKIPHTDRQLKEKICKLLNIDEEAILSYKVTRRSVDARKKPELFYVYTAEVLEEGNIPNIDSRNFAAAGGWLYYMENPSTLKRISLEKAEGGTGLAGGETVLTVSDILEAVAGKGGAGEGYGSSAIRDYAVESDGSICCLLEVNISPDSIAVIQNSGRSPENGDKNSPRGLLYKQSPEGETAVWTELPELGARTGLPRTAGAWSMC